MDDIREIKVENIIDDIEEGSKWTFAEVNNAIASPELAHLSLTCIQVDEWCQIQRSHYDFNGPLDNYPYRAMEILVNPESGKVISRLFGRTSQDGTADCIQDLITTCQQFFNHIPCLGSAKQQEHLVLKSHPFDRYFSPHCEDLVLMEGIQAGYGICDACENLAKFVAEDVVDENDICEFQMEEGDMALDDYQSEENAVDVKVKVKKEPRGRGRPRGRKPRKGSEYTCTVEGCNHQLLSRMEYNKHLKRKHFIGRYQCPACPDEPKKSRTIVQSLEELYEHMTTGHRESPLMCPNCKEAVYDATCFEDYRQHLKECLNKKNREKALENLKKRRENLDSQFHCHQCGKSFLTNAKLEDHANEHMGLTPYVCDKENCSYKSHSRYLLKMHVKRHIKQEEVGEYVCELCGVSYKEKSSYENHMLRHQGVEMPKVQCPYCPRKMAGKPSLNRHILTKHSEQKFCCHLCNTRFGYQAQLNRHLVQVHKEPDMLCKYCGMAFKYKDSFKDHMRQHTGETPYECQYCQYKAKSSSVLRKHQLSNHKELVKPINT